MLPRTLPRLRFSLNSIMLLSLGFALGYAWNLWWWRLPDWPTEANMRTFPAYVIEPPDVLSIDVFAGATSANAVVSGEQLVAMDGRIKLGKFGSVYVAGMTTAEAEDAVNNYLAAKVDQPRASIDVRAFNSKVYYVVQERRRLGDDVTRLPVTGKETVLDAVAAIGGILAPDETKIWIARPSPQGVGPQQILPVDWKAITTGDSITANYQMFPGDRLFISAPTKAAAAQSENNPSSAADESDESDDQVREAAYMDYNPSQVNAPSTPADVDLPNYFQFVRPQLEAQQNRQAPAIEK